MPDSEKEERRSRITDDELNYIAEELEKRMYENIGKNVVSRFLWFVGLVSVSVYAYLKGKGIL